MEELLVKIEHPFRGENISITANLSTSILDLCPEIEHVTQLFQSRHQFLFLKIVSSEQITLHSQLPLAHIAPWVELDTDSFELDHIHVHKRMFLLFKNK